MKNVKRRRQVEAVQRQERRITEMLAELEKRRKRVKQRERKERDRRVIGIGEQAWIAGILTIGECVLLGALLSAQALRADAKWRQRWEREGEFATVDWEEGGKTAALRDELRNLGAGDIGSAIKRRTHLQAKLGGVIESAGWGSENPQLLLGVLLLVKRGLADPNKVKSWKKVAATQSVARAASQPQRPSTESRRGKI